MDCVKNPNYSKCPMRMDDGRHFTDYRANNFINSDIRYKKGLVTGAEYRSYLTHNAVDIMNENSKLSWSKNGCGPCKNVCLGIDETNRPGNSSSFDERSCIPPADYFRYVGSDGTKLPLHQPQFTRPTVPGGTILKN
tara:strand:+ start:5186 stop:5596 length:411 start_codon:yes stop_codon:yes gene_type:complete